MTLKDVSASEPPGDSRFTPDGASTIIVSSSLLVRDRSFSEKPEYIDISNLYSPSASLPEVITELITDS